MYMTAQKLIKNRTTRGYLVGSRGSVGSSVVAYFCGISEVNPSRRTISATNAGALNLTTAKHTAAVRICRTKSVPNAASNTARTVSTSPFSPSWALKRRKEPDIDLNFAGEYQTQAHRDCVELFG